MSNDLNWKFIHSRDDSFNHIRNLIPEKINVLFIDTIHEAEHVEKYPNLHELVWKANKLAGTNKQNVNSESAGQLVEAVDEIAKIFWATKGVDYDDDVSTIRFGT